MIVWTLPLHALPRLLDHVNFAAEFDVFVTRSWSSQPSVVPE
jgi:hypothetical protein